MIPAGAPPWSRTWPLSAWSAELVVLLAEESRKARRPYLIPGRRPETPYALRLRALAGDREAEAELGRRRDAVEADRAHRHFRQVAL